MKTSRRRDVEQKLAVWTGFAATIRSSSRVETGVCSNCWLGARMANARKEPTESPPTLGLRRFAMRLPEAEEGTSCVNRAFRAWGKTFAYLGMKADRYKLMVNLTDSVPRASAPKRAPRRIRRRQARVDHDLAAAHGEGAKGTARGVDRRELSRAGARAAGRATACREGARFQPERSKTDLHPHGHFCSLTEISSPSGSLYTAIRTPNVAVGGWTHVTCCAISLL